MSISTNYGAGSYDPSFYDLVKHDVSEVEKKGGFAKLDTLADLRASGDKLMRTEDIESLMKNMIPTVMRLLAKSVKHRIMTMVNYPSTMEKVR